jgi:hypothetical protein
MRLSQAIRLGAKLSPQCFGRFYDKETQATCALGAATEALRARLHLEEQYPRSLDISPVNCRVGALPQSSCDWSCATLT